MAQKSNGLEFDEEIEEFEESLENAGSPDKALLSHENLFLLMAMAIVVIFGVIFVMFVRRRYINRRKTDSQVQNKYKQLGASFGAPQARSRFI